MKSKGTTIAKAVLKKNEVGGISLLNFKTYSYSYQDHVTLKLGKIHRLPTQIKLIFYKGGNAIPWRR